VPGHRSPSFSRLKDVLTQLPQRQPIEESVDDRIVVPADAVTNQPANHNTSAIQTLDIQGTAAVQQSSSHSVSGRSALAARPGKAKVITRPSTFRLAVELQDALKAVAEYNGLNMTDIVAESIWLHLQNFEWPPESDQLRQSLRRLF